MNNTKPMQKRVLDILLNKTAHNSTSEKIILFGSKQKFMHLNNTTLYLVVLTWLRQLQQCFLEKTEYKPARDWNKYGRYCGTLSKVAAGHPTLLNINISTVNSMRSNIVLEVYYFKPNKDRTDVVTSLEEWAARLLKPDVILILTEAEKDDETKARFIRAK
jgi:hypothetical protein